MKLLKKLIKHKLITFLLVIHSLISTIALIYIFDNWKLWSISHSVQNWLRSPRILCFVATYQKNHAKNVRAIKDTWGSRCDILYFASSVTDPSLPSFTVNCTKHDHDHLWCKTQKGIIYGVDTYRDGWDWMLKADDDTYVIMDNLKYLLSQHDPNEPIWFGCQFALGGDHNQKYMSGGTTYSLTQTLINILFYFRRGLCE